MVTALMAHLSASEVRDLLDPLDAEALLAACEPLAAAIAASGATQNAIDAARALLTWIKEQAPYSWLRLKASCALVRCWAPTKHLSALARSAYDIALRQVRSGYGSWTSSGAFIYQGTLKDLSGSRPRGSRYLSELAAAARALQDRKVLLDLWSEIHEIVSRKPRSADADNALVDIAAGLAGLDAGESDPTLSPPFLATSRSYRPLAYLELAAVIADVQPGEPYRVTKRKRQLPRVLAMKRRFYIKEALSLLPSSPFIWHAELAEKWDATLLTRMIARLAAEQLYEAIPRVVWAAQRSLDVDEGQKGGVSKEPMGVTQGELDEIVDAAVAALMAGAQATLAQKIVKSLPEHAPGVHARLAAIGGSPQEIEKILFDSLDQAWNPITVTAVASTATGLPSRAARLALAVRILGKARMHQRREVLQAFGALIPLAGSILSPADLSDAIDRIIASEGYW